MVKGGKRGGRVRDKWRDKKWIVVKSPSAFGGGFLNYIPITATENAQGRVIENTMFDILKQDPTQHQIKVFVQIDKITEGNATTIFKGHEYAKEFLRSLIRRGSSMITHVHDYTTMDGYTFRVVLIALLRHIGIKKTKLISTPESRAILEAKPLEISLSSTEQADNENE